MESSKWSKEDKCSKNRVPLVILWLLEKGVNNSEMRDSGYLRGRWRKNNSLCKYVLQFMITLLTYYILLSTEIYVQWNTCEFLLSIKLQNINKMSPIDTYEYFLAFDVSSCVLGFLDWHPNFAPVPIYYYEKFTIAYGRFCEKKAKTIW